jgi:hypothetical protein
MDIQAAKAKGRKSFIKTEEVKYPDTTVWIKDFALLQ